MSENEPCDCVEALPQLVAGAGKLGIALDAEQQRQFVAYCRAIEEGNRIANLTGVKTSRGIMTSLFLDSLTIAAALPDKLTGPNALTAVVDVGAGAGLPGIPLKLVFPAWSLTLIESIGKKARFLTQTVESLGLTDTEVVLGRAEEVAAARRHRDTADLATARAVAPLATLIELCAPFVKPGGWLAFPKSGEIAAELDAALAATRALKVELVATRPVPESLGLGAGRVTVLYRKRAATPPGYPRRVGLARARPIGSAPK